jgi:O-antigen/teichoic acid export membrane protein
MNLVESIKNLLRHSTIYSLATFLQRFIGLLMLPFLTDPAYIATKAEFADFTLYYTFVSFMNILFLYGMDASFMRYSILSDRGIKTVFTSAFATVLGTGLIYSLLIFLFREPLGEVIFLQGGMGKYLLLAVLLLFLDSLGNFSYLLLRSTERSGLFSFLKIFRFLLEFSLNILFVIYLKVGWVGMVYGNLTASLVNLLILLWINRGYFIARYDFSLVKEMVSFGLPFIPNSLAYMLIELVDRLIVPHILSKEALAVYAANYRFGMVMGALILAFRNAWQPFFLKISKQDNARELFGKIFLVFITLTGGWLLITSYIIPDFIRLKLFGGMSFINENYWEGISIIPVLLASYFFYGIYVYFTLGVYIEKKNKWIGLITFSGAVVNVAVNLLLLPVLGIWGAALATLAAYGTMALGMYLYNQAIYYVRLPFFRIIRLLILLALYLIFPYLFPESGFFVKLFLLAVFPPLLYFTGVINRENMESVRNILRLGKNAE